MAAKTHLSLTATPGKARTFSAKKVIWTKVKIYGIDVATGKEVFIIGKINKEI